MGDSVGDGSGGSGDQWDAWGTSCWQLKVCLGCHFMAASLATLLLVITLGKVVRMEWLVAGQVRIERKGLENIRMKRSCWAG